MQKGSGIVEPWLRGTRQSTPALPRAVLHALDLARQDFDRWVWPLGAEWLEERPFDLPSAGFQARHVARSLDRLLTYAEGKQLTGAQLSLLASETEVVSISASREEFEAGLLSAEARILALPVATPDEARFVGRARLPVTLGGLLVHLADHTQRHAGQAVTTAKVVTALHCVDQG